MAVKRARKPTKDSEIYLRAAEILVTNNPPGVSGFSCLAIDVARAEVVGFREISPERCIYEKLFKPVSNNGVWGSLWGKDAPSCRVLALLFMSAIAKSEGR